MVARFAVALVTIAGVCALSPIAGAGDFDDAVALYESGDYATARDRFEALARSYEATAEVHYYLGQALSELGELESAQAAYEQAIEADGSKARYQIGLGAAIGNQINPKRIFKAMGQSRRARKAFETAVELEPENLDALSALMQFYLRAPGIAGGDLKKAREQAEKIGTLDALRGHLAMASVYERTKDHEAALKEYEMALREFPDDEDVPFAYGLYLTSIGKYGEAVEIYRSVLHDNPDDHRVRYQMGRTASISGQFLDDGRDALTAYLDYTPLPGEPSHAWAHYRLGLIEAQTDNVDAARRHYTAAIALDSNHKEARDALKDLGRR